MSGAWRLPVVAASTLGLLGALTLLPAGEGAAQVPPNQPKDLRSARFFSVATCRECHTTRGERPDDMVLLTEYATWRTKDRHSLAYAALEGPRGRQMGRLLGIPVAGEPACLGCHATSFRPGQPAPVARLRDGVSCDGCHGPAQHWYEPHSSADNREQWRATLPGEKEGLGMFDVRDPVKRARLCMSCHVGSAAEGKVVTHAMYAAGHPPLPGFELDGFLKNMPPHWRDLRDVPYFQEADPQVRRTYQYDMRDFQHTQSALATAVVGVRQAMLLLAARADVSRELPELARANKSESWPPPWLQGSLTSAADRHWPELQTGVEFGLSKNPRERWPEIAMAQADCYACHHDLKSDSWRQLRGYPGAPGRPRSQAWPFALTDLGLSDNKAAALAGPLGELHRAFDARPFGEPAAVARAAARLWLGSFKLGDPSAPLDQDSARRALRRLCSLPEHYYPDYDSARQIAWAFRALCEDAWNAGAPRRAEVEAVLRDLDDELSLTLKSPSRREFVAEREALVSGRLGPGKSEKEISEALGSEEFLARLQAISDRELAAALQRVSLYDPTIFRRRMAELRRLLGD